MAVGRHIKVKRPNGWVATGMDHHGIYMGDDTVVHFTGMKKKKAQILRTNLVVFQSAGQAELVDYEHIKTFRPARFGNEFIDFSRIQLRPPADVIADCLAHLGFAQGTWDAYTNNCEHFATTMATGIGFSLHSLSLYRHLNERGTGLSFLVSALFEGDRFFNSKGEFPNITNFLYSSSGLYFIEHYESPCMTPPTWLYSNSLSGPWSIIDQRQVPYPLSYQKCW